MARSLRGISRRPRIGSEAAGGIAEVETLPVPSLDALAGAMFVATAVACWIAVASTATAPLVAAGELLTRAARHDRGPGI